MFDLVGMYLRNSKWFFIGLALGALLAVGVKAQAQEHKDLSPATVTGKNTEPQDAKHDHGVYGAMMNEVGLIMIQNGQFTCKKDEHRAVMHQRDDLIFLGCATVTDAAVSIRWETGQTTTWKLPPPSKVEPVPQDNLPAPAPQDDNTPKSMKL